MAVQEFVKAHGVHVRDVMTRSPISVSETDGLGQIANTFERHRVKRVPVVRDRKVVGIISRADLVRALAERSAAGDAGAPRGDKEIDIAAANSAATRSPRSPAGGKS